MECERISVRCRQEHLRNVIIPGREHLHDFAAHVRVKQDIFVKPRIALTEAGCVIQRVSGTSAGSVVGAILAAGTQGPKQLTPGEIKQLTMTVPYRKFLDPTPITAIPLLGPAWGVLGEEGIYKGDFAHDWIRSELENLGYASSGPSVC